MVIIIVYEGKTPVNPQIECVGVTGDNLHHLQKFFIKGITDKNINYTIYLRFADGTVNAVVPDSSRVDSEGVEILWRVAKSHIFCHGFFELQIEGKSDGGAIFQTEIVRMYADESIAAESSADSGGNTLIVSLRDEIEDMLDKITAQQEQIDANVKYINETNSGKLDNTLGSVNTFNLADGAVTEAKLDYSVIQKLDRIISLEAQIGTLNAELEAVLSGGE